MHLNYIKLTYLFILVSFIYIPKAKADWSCLCYKEKFEEKAPLIISPSGLYIIARRRLHNWDREFHDRTEYSGWLNSNSHIDGW